MKTKVGALFAPFCRDHYSKTLSVREDDSNLAFLVVARCLVALVARASSVWSTHTHPCTFWKRASTEQPFTRRGSEIASEIYTSSRGYRGKGLAAPCSPAATCCLRVRRRSWRPHWRHLSPPPLLISVSSTAGRAGRAGSGGKTRPLRQKG